MKKIWTAAAAFAAGTLLQLLCSILFHFSEITSGKVITMLCLLAASGLCLLLWEVPIERAVRRGTLDDRTQGLIYYINRLGSVLLGAETLNAAALAVSLMVRLPSWIHTMFSAGISILCVISAYVIIKLIRNEQTSDTAKK